MRRLLQRIITGKSSLLAIVQTTAANVGIQGANVLTGILVARSLGPDGRGAVTAVTMWPQFLAYTLTVGVPVATVYNLKRKPEMASSVSGASMFLSFLLGCLATIIGLIVIPWSLHTYSLHVIRMAQIAMFVAPLALYGITLASQAQAAGSFIYYNLFRFLPPVSILVVLTVLRVTGTLTVGHAAIAYLLSSGPVMFWNLYWVHKRFKPTLRKAFEACRLILRYGIRAWGGDLLGAIGNQIDRILVVGMLAPEAMGFYAVAQSAAAVLNAIPGAVVPVTLPRATGGSEKEIVALAGRAGRMTLFTMVAAGVPFFLAGKFLIRLFYGHKFAPSAPLFHILLLETILDGVTWVLSQAFLAAGYPGTTTLLQGCGVLSAIPLLLWLIPKWGVIGAAIALTLATSFRLAFILLNFPLRLKVRPPSLIITWEELQAVLLRRRLAV